MRFFQKWLKRLSNWIKEVSIVLSYARFSVVSLIVLLILFWFTDQGQDLLVSMHGSKFHFLIVPVFLLFISVLAGLNWYWPRYFFRENLYYVISKKKKAYQASKGAEDRAGGKPKRKERFLATTLLFNNDIWKNQTVRMSSYHADIPRLLGVLTFLMVGGAMIEVLELQGFSRIKWLTDLWESEWPSTIYMIVWFGLFIIMSLKKVQNWWVGFLSKRPWVLFGLVTVLFLLAIAAGALNDGGQTSLFWFAQVVGLCALIFFIVVTLRQRVELQHHRGLSLFTKINLPYVLLIASIFVGSCFILVNLVAKWAPLMTPILVILSALVLYVGLISLIAFLSRVYDIRFLTILVLVIILLSNLPDGSHLSARLADKDKKVTRISLEEHFKQWVFHREKDILASDGKYPVFLSCSYGGGSRAAYWANLVHSTLQDKSKGQFTQHLFSVSGVSGGAFGNTAFITAVAHDALTGSVDTFRSLVRPIHSGDYLSASAALLLGRDFWHSVIPANLCRDRGKVLEDEWGDAIQDRLGGDKDWFELPFDHFWNSDQFDSLRYDIPLLFNNTTMVETGQRAISAPVVFHHRHIEGIDLLATIDYQYDSAKTLPLGTATLLCARFPYVNPGAKIEKVGHFVDGGYHDNSGSLTTFEILQTLKGVVEEMKGAGDDTARLFDSLDFHLISIFNDPKPGRSDFLQDRKDKEDLKDVPEISIPLATLYATQSATPYYADELLMNEFTEDHYFRMNVVPCKIEGRAMVGEPEMITPIIPLGRYISDNAVEALEQNIEEENSKANIESIVGILEKARH